MNLTKALAITGWMAQDELEFLADIASKSKVIIEFGCFKGRSTRALADNTDGIIYAVDPWVAEYYADNGDLHGIKPNVFPEFARNLGDHIVSGKVIPIQKYSTEFDPAFVSDFIFIDGDHRYQAVKDDINHSLKLMKSGILAGHDYGHASWPGVQKVVDELFPNAQKVNSIWWVKI